MKTNKSSGYCQSRKGIPKRKKDKLSVRESMQKKGVCGEKKEETRSK